MRLQFSFRNFGFAFPYVFAFGAVLAGCGAPPALDDNSGYDTDGKADSWSTTLGEDNLNGLWKTSVDGNALADETVIDSWPSAGIRIHFDGSVYQASRSGTTLVGDSVALDLKANKRGVRDDAIEGTIAGQSVKLSRDVDSKDPITLSLPGDRPFRSFLTELLVPAAQRDRESYVTMHAKDVGSFLSTCELYKHGSWQRQFMKGATLSAQYQSFWHIIYSIDGAKETPHSLIHNGGFIRAVNSNIKDKTKAALAASTFSMYFSTAAGRAIRLPITDDSMAYFITDRPSRGARIGLVAMTTPLHGPLASTFGRQLLDMGAMPASDNPLYARAMMHLLIESDPSFAAELSPTGRSALTDWFAVMAIEDYRGVAFGSPSLGWGYNMTNVQFYGLIARALAHPDQMDSAGKPILGQVIVGSELRPGDPSYADVLNGGNDMQEYPDMAQLKTLTTAFLREQHPELIAEVQAAFAEVVPADQLGWLASEDIFHFIASELYDSTGRIDTLKGAAADRAVNAVVALLDGIDHDAAGLESYLLAHGITKSNEPAPKSTGF